MAIMLHLHTDGSLLDGKAKVDEVISRVKELGEDSIAITNHGNMVTAFTFYEKCLENNIKPIIGCEVYVGEEGDSNKYHLILLAKNEIGYKNLLYLQYYSHMKNFHSKARVDYNTLMSKSEGLICSTACIGSEVGQNFIKGNKSEAVLIIDKLHSIFKDDFYLEIQPNSIPIQKDYNKFLCEVSKVKGIPMIVTTDAHYTKKEDADSHDTLLCMQIKKKKAEEERFKFTGNDFYLMSDSDILERLNYLDVKDVESAIQNTYTIRDKCNVEIKTGANYLPKFCENAPRRLAELCNEGLKKRMAENAFKDVDLNEVIARVKRELQDYTKKGYADYFLIITDLLEYCKKEDIFYGCGRGSVAGSEIAFLLGITEIEPIKYGLLSERFLNPTRNSHPDIDTDLCYIKRHDAIQYLKDKYGENNVAGIIAEGRLTLSSVVRKVLSTYGYEMDVINKVASYLKEKYIVEADEEEDEKNEKYKNVTEAYEHNEQFREFFDNLKPEIQRDIKSLEGTISHFSKHAAGLIIAPDEVYNYIPVMRDSKEVGMMMSQWDKHTIEDIGLYKFDLLGLKLLTIFDLTLKQIEKNRGIKITREDLFKIDVEDKGIYEVLNNESMIGIFQFEGSAGAKTVLEAKPSCFEDVIVCESICRPGVKESGKYIENRKAFRETGEFPKPSYWGYVKDVLEVTYDAIVYQEQTMLLFNKLADFDLGEADSLRKAKSLEPYKERFVNGCISKGMKKSEAIELFERFDLGYSFNKSHATVYALNSVVCAWLKKNYRAEFMSACMTLALTKSKKKNEAHPALAFIKDATKYGIKVKTPDINFSTNQFVAISEDEIVLPLNMIEGLGEKVVFNIMSKRPFTSLQDMKEKLTGRECNKTHIKKLVKAGAFDRLQPNRLDLLSSLEEQIESLFTPELKGRYEREVLGMSLSSNPLDNYVNRALEDIEDGEVSFLNAIINEIKVVKDKKGNEMAFVKFENKECIFEGLVFSKVYKQYKGLFYRDTKVKVSGKRDGTKMLVNKIEFLH